MALYDRAAHCYALGARSDRVGGVLDIGAGDDSALMCEEGATDAEERVRTCIQNIESVKGTPEAIHVELVAIMVYTVTDCGVWRGSCPTYSMRCPWLLLLASKLR